MSIKHMLTQTCDIYANTVGADGLPGYSVTPSHENEPCRHEESIQQVQKSDKTIVITDSLIYVGPNVTVSENDKVVIDGVSYIVDKPSPARGITSVSHYELRCRRLYDGA